MNDMSGRWQAFRPIEENILYWWSKGLPPYEIGKKVGWSASAVSRQVRRLRKRGHPLATRRDSHG